MDRRHGREGTNYKIRPGDLDVSVEVEKTPQLSRPHDTIVVPAQITVIRKTPYPVRCRLLVGEAAESHRLDARFNEFKVDLRTTNSLTISTRLKVPPGDTHARARFPVALVVGHQTNLTMDFIVARQPAWYVVGPFEGGPNTAHDTEFPPEKHVEFASEYTGKSGCIVRWKSFRSEAITEAGYFNLEEGCSKAENATAYALLEVVASSARPARIAVGSDDSIKIWHNGRLVHSKLVVRSAEPAQDIVPITIAEGTNKFLLKVCNETGGWGYFFALQDVNGAPLRDVWENTVVRRVLITDPMLRLTEVTRTTASVAWESDVPNLPRVIVRRAVQGRALPVWGPVPKHEMVKPDPASTPTIVQTTAYSTRHMATIAGLEPGKRYLVTVEPGCAGVESEPLSFYTAPPTGLTQFLRLRLICIIFSNVTRDNSITAPGAKISAPAQEIERIKWEMRQTQLFYWVNSGMRLHLDVDYIVDDRFYEVDDAVYGLGFTGKDEAAFEELLPRHGRKVSDYDGRLFISIVKRWEPGSNPGEGTWLYEFGGGGTIGPEEYPGYGKSAWRGGGTSNSAWLFCHEFHHQLDALYHYSMGPEYLFNHFQPWDGTAHRHGEHWDGNGWILWEWAGYVTREHQWYPLLEPKLGFRYFTCRWGEVVQVPDSDDDGIPDDEPSVPLDEKRLGSNPLRADSDSDGLSDMMEVMACRWLEFGLDEIWGGNKESHRCNLIDPDADKDGLLDGHDPYPIYPIDPIVHKALNATGPISSSAFHPLVKFRDQAYEADFKLAWNNEYFVIAMEAPTPPANMRIMLDMNDDGWFVGGDNYDVRIHPKGGAPAGEEWKSNQDGTFAAAFHNCSVVGKWPFYDADWHNNGVIEFFQNEAGDAYKLEIRVRGGGSGALAFHDGKHIGILISINPEGGNGRKGAHGALTVFEPHTFFTITLRK